MVVIGGSQAGLAMAWYLARQHLRFVVLEAGPERAARRLTGAAAADPSTPVP